MIKLGKIGYEAYRAHTGGISLATGGPIPEWDLLRADISAAWEAAADAIASVLTEHQEGENS